MIPLPISVHAQLAENASQNTGPTFSEDQKLRTPGMPPSSSSNSFLPSENDLKVRTPEMIQQQQAGEVSGNQDQSTSESGYWTNDDYIGTGDDGSQDSNSGGVTWATKKEVLDRNIIGLPPIAYTSDGGEEMEKMRRLIVASMPVVEIMPCLASFGSANAEGLNLFHLDPKKGESKYKDILKTAGFNMKEGDLKLPLQVAFLNEGQIGESWSSAYGDTDFENKINSMGNNTLAELRQMTGSSDIGEMITDLEQGGDKRGDFAGGMLALGGGLASFGYGLGSAALGGLLGEDNAQAAIKVLGGSKVDFPTIWQGSSFDPSYTLTVKLYNPYPKDKDSYESFILLPLAKLVAFCVPLTDSPYVYDFPLMCKVKCPGMFKLPAAVISSISVVKGGSMNDITFQQQPSVVEVQLTIQSLYSTMVANTTEEAEEKSDEERPTLKKYFDNLRDWYDYKNFLKSTDTGAGVPQQGAGDMLGMEDYSLDELDILDDFSTRIPEDLGGMTDTLSGAFDGVNAGIGNITEGIGGAIDGVTGSIDSVMGAVNGTVTGAIGGLTGAVNDGLNGLFGGFGDFSVGIGDCFGTGGLGGSIGEIYQSIDSGLFGANIGIDNALGRFDISLGQDFVGMNANLNIVNDIDRMVVDSFNSINSNILGPIGGSIDGLASSVNGVLDEIGGFTSIPDSVRNRLLFSVDNMTSAGISNFSVLNDRLDTLQNVINLPNGQTLIDDLTDKLDSSYTIFDEQVSLLQQMQDNFNVFDGFSGIMPDQFKIDGLQAIIDALEITSTGGSVPAGETSASCLSRIGGVITEISEYVKDRIEEIQNLDFSRITTVREMRNQVEFDLASYASAHVSEKPEKRNILIDEINALKAEMEQLKTDLSNIRTQLATIQEESKVNITNKIEETAPDRERLIDNTAVVDERMTTITTNLDDMRDYMEEFLIENNESE